MNNENQNQNEAPIIPLENVHTAQEPIIDSVPDWIKELEQELGVDGIEVLKKQAESTELVPEELRKNSVASIRKLAEVSKGYFTENELIFMYVVGIQNLMTLTQELHQTKQMIQFFAGSAIQMGDLTGENEEQTEQQ